MRGWISAFQGSGELNKWKMNNLILLKLFALQFALSYIVF